MFSKHLSSRLRAIDWDFAGAYSESAFSSLHWHPSRFVSQIPATLIGLLSEEGGLVLDPFCGSGTTLVEAQRLGRRAVGVDLHPVSCLVARVKTLSCSSWRIEAHVQRLEDDATAVLSRQRSLGRRITNTSLMPSTVQAEKWYMPEVQADLSALWSTVTSYGGRARTIAEAVFSAILLPVCRESRHWGYVCDNSCPRGSGQRNVLDQYKKTLGRLLEAYRQRERDLTARLAAGAAVPRVKVVREDARSALVRIGRGEADLVVTSPPYFGVADYVKAQRLSMEWFGWEIEMLRRQEIGARSKRHRRTAVSQYLSELGETFELLKSRLRRGAVAVFVLGESRSRAPVVGRIKGTLEEVGFSLEMDINRTVSSQRRQAPSLGGEHLLVCVAR